MAPTYQPRCPDGRAHSRRQFLRQLLGTGAGTLVLGQLPVQTLAASPLMTALAGVPDDRVLVFLRLKGGNDGLNTLIPVHDYGRYRAARPKLYIPEEKALRLENDLALHPRLAPLEGLWKEGAMRIVRNVGYSNQNLSHFRSSDIWATASDSDETVGSGVLGRYLQHAYPDYLSNPPAQPPALQIGGAGNLLFNNSQDFNYAVSTSDPDKLYEIARTGALHDLDGLPDCSYGDQLGYLRAVANTTFRYAGVLADAFAAGRNDGEYLDDALGKQLALVARLLRGGLGTRLFVVELDGFDTHAGQLDLHADLLGSVATNVKEFYADLSRDGTDRRVLTVTFSEFGRRVEENGSEGTDHGAAAPMLLIGPGLEGNGTVGEAPELGTFDRHGNLIPDTDFRSVYATVLSRWLCLDDGVVDLATGGTHPQVEGLGLSCAGVTSVDRPTSLSPDFDLRVTRSGAAIRVAYQLPERMRAHVYLSDTLGRRLRTVFAGVLPGGPHEHLLSEGLPAGVYVISLEAGGQVTARKLPLF